MKIFDLSLDLTTGISTPTAEGKAVRTEIYNLGGQAQNQLQRGVNIVKTTYADGRVDVRKVIAK